MTSASAPAPRARLDDFVAGTTLQFGRFAREIRAERPGEVRLALAEILAGAGGEVALTVQARQIAQLELDGVRTGLLGEVDELLRELHVPLVVVADLGDDEAAVALTDRVAPNADLAAERVARNRTHVPALVDERDDAHAVTERLGDRRRLGAVRQLDR